MDRRKLIKGVIGAALVPFIPTALKAIAPEPKKELFWHNPKYEGFVGIIPTIERGSFGSTVDEPYKYDVHGEQFYAGKTNFHVYQFDLEYDEDEYGVRIVKMINSKRIK